MKMALFYLGVGDFGDYNIIKDFYIIKL